MASLRITILPFFVPVLGDSAVAVQYPGHGRSTHETGGRDPDLVRILIDHLLGWRDDTHILGFGWQNGQDIRSACFLETHNVTGKFPSMNPAVGLLYDLVLQSEVKRSDRTGSHTGGFHIVEQW